MFNSPLLDVVARVVHRCTNCGEAINPKERYKRWVTFDDSAYTSKMHPECYESLCCWSEGGQFEYTPFNGERPKI